MPINERFPSVCENPHFLVQFSKILPKNYPNLVPLFSKFPPNRGQQITLLSKKFRIREKVINKNCSQ